MITRAEVVAEARTWIGTNYAHQQRTKGVAVDCAGLVIGVARNLGLVAPDFDIGGYPRQPDGTMLIRCEELMTRVPMNRMDVGDVAVMTFEVEPCHFAILGDYHAGGLTAIHALLRRGGSGKVVEHRLDARLARVVAVYRLPGVT